MKFRDSFSDIRIPLKLTNFSIERIPNKFEIVSKDFKDLYRLVLLLDRYFSSEKQLKMIFLIGYNKVHLK